MSNINNESNFLANDNLNLKDSIENDKFESLKYLESVEIEYFLRLLLKEVIANNPEDPLGFASLFFRKIRTCQYVLSKDVNFIRESIHNRGSFIVCVMEAFSGFPEGTEMSLFEFSSFLGLTYSGFSIEILQNFASALDPSAVGEALDANKYNLNHLLSSLYFWILYENWLVELEKLSQAKDSTTKKEGLKNISLPAVLSWLKSLRYDEGVCGPPRDILTALLNELMELRGESDMNYDRLRQVFFLNSAIQADILTKIPKPFRPPENG